MTTPLETASKTLEKMLSRPAVGLDVLRIYLGAALVVRGALFVSDPSQVVALLEANTYEWFTPMLIAHYVAMAHLGGGLLLMIGLVTRLAAAVQLPALFGAVFFIHLGEGLLAPGQSLELAGLVLVMLATFTVVGAGPVSADRFVFGRVGERRRRTAGGTPTDEGLARL